MPESSGAPSRVAALSVFGLAVVLTQVAWLTFSPITDDVARDLDVGSGPIGDLTALNPLVFVLLALPAGRLLDRRLPHGVLLGAGLTAAGASIRVLDPGSFGMQLAGQVVISIGQPFVVAATAAMAVRYASAGARATVIALVSAAQFIGILVAAATTGPVYGAVGLGGLLWGQALVAVGVAAGLALALARARPLHATGVEAAGEEQGDLPGVVARARPPHRDGFLIALAVTLFVGVGVFNAVATWLDTILHRLGHPDAAGALIAAMTLAGILGALVIPGWASRAERRREVLMLAAVTTAAGFLLSGLLDSFAVVVVVLILVGVLLLPGLPIALEWAEVRVGPARSARTTSLLLLAGNAGGVVLVLGVQAFLSSPTAAFVAIAVLTAPAIVSTLVLPSSTATSGTAPLEERTP